MSTSEERKPGREISRALEQTLEQAMAPGASWEAVAAARNAAQLLSLAGLDQLMSLLELGVETRSDGLARAFDRLRHHASECVKAGSLLPLQSADAELGGMAVHLLAQTPGVSASAMADPETALRLGDVLEDMPIRHEDLAALSNRVRLAAPVAAALRAAVDWLAGDEPAVPLRLTAEGGTLEVSFDQVNPVGLASAHHVLSSVGGNFGPANGGEPGHRGRWIVRVPALSERNSYLMLIQGSMRLAISWHSILRLHMIPQSEVRSGIRHLRPVLDPISPLQHSAAECPVVMIGHGAKRAYLVADRLVWRMAADPIESSEAAPNPVLSRPVRTDEGDVYWIAEPARLLDDVDDPALIEMERTALREGSMLPTLGAGDVQPLAFEFSDGSEARAETGTDPTTPVKPEARAAIIPVSASRAARPLGRGKTAKPKTDGSKRVLIAEYSVSARVFLTRLLEQMGWEVKGVATANELLAELYEESWSMICVDVDLPDGRGVEFLRALAHRQAEAGSKAPIVALVRDVAAARPSAEAGFEHALHKPFERERLENLLVRLTLADENRHGS